MLIEDFCFYWGHRFLHHRWVYPHIHKVHHTFTHTVSIANEYTHPVEFLISNIVTKNFLFAFIDLFIMYSSLRWQVLNSLENRCTWSRFGCGFSLVLENLLMGTADMNSLGVHIVSFHWVGQRITTISITPRTLETIARFSRSGIRCSRRTVTTGYGFQSMKKYSLFFVGLF